jgi:hypothetical protein
MKSKKLSILLIIFLLLAFCAPGKNTFARSFFKWNGIQNGLQLTTSADMGTVCFGALTATSIYGKVIELKWPTGFDLTNLVVSDTEADSEIEVYFGHDDCTGTARVAEATETADNNRDLAEVDTVNNIVRLTLEDNYDGSFSIKFIPKPFGTEPTIITPATAGNYPLTASERITADGPTTGSQIDLLYVGNLNQVNISASVDPSLTLNLDTNTCDLGTLDATKIKTCNYTSTVSTNAATGYSGYIRADGAFRSGSHSMADVGDGAVTATHEEYGISTTQGTKTISQINDANGDTYYTSADCTTMDSQSSIEATSSVVTTDDKTFAGSSAPVDSDTATVCHAVGITPTTPAGSYAQLVTITVVGNF